MKALGIDLGGTSAKIGLVEDGQILNSASVPTRKDSDYEGILGDIVKTSKQLISNERIGSVGIGSPGLIDTASGTVRYSNNIRWENAPLKDDIQKALGVPAYIANDAKCAALGEAIYGAGAGYSRFAMLTLGTGVGGGFVVNGKLEEGTLYGDASGIYGHLTLYPDGRPCTCGRRGCLEAYCSARAVENKAQSILGKKVSAKAIFEAAANHNFVAEEIVDEFTRNLAVALVSLANILRPQCFAIGGGLSADAEQFLPYVNEMLEKEVYGWAYAPVKAVRAKLGNTAGMIGAAALNRK